MLEQFEQFAEKFIKENEKQCAQIDHLTQCWIQVKEKIDEIVKLSDNKGVK